MQTSKDMIEKEELEEGEIAEQKEIDKRRHKRHDRKRERINERDKSRTESKRTKRESERNSDRTRKNGERGRKEMKGSEMKDLSKLTGRMRQLLCSNGGSMELERLGSSLELSTNQMGQLLGAEMGRSLMIGVFNGEKVAVSRSAVRVCSGRTKQCKGDCEKLHLCRYYILGSCNRNPCAFNHDIHSGPNLAVLKMYDLDDLNMVELRQLLLQNDPSFLPEVCVHYNKGNGIFGFCKHGSNCKKLHLCQYFLDGDCKYQQKCKRSHDCCEEHNEEKLKNWGVSEEWMPKFLGIFRNVSVLRDSRSSLPKKKASSAIKEIPLSSGSDEKSQPDKADEICLYYIRKSCSFKDKCGKNHCHLPYRWQVQKNNHWEDMENIESIEEAFCNVNKTNLMYDLNFDSMTYKSFKIRRLSTPSSAAKPPHYTFTTEWLWYWKDQYNTWNEYGKEGSVHKAADVCSTDLEKAYLSDTSATLQFKAGTENYELRFKDMVQKNLKHKTERKVCRRPRFVSEKEVKQRRSRKPESSEEDRKLIPKHWDMALIPDVGYKLVTLDQSSDEYKKVKDSFHLTLRNVSIQSIERIQNPALWEVYQWQKEQMKKQRGGTEVEERQLFHGTEDKWAEAICQQNFDWRICGTHGTSYGKGSYFAKDASYSHSYTLTTFSKSRVMFMARVLVGDFTTGSYSYLRPPAKNQLTSSCFYDSCVDSITNPSIFVIFEKHQIYPEYLIKYL
ncbi:protein mono-ADP-ribosyltransferase PARP12 [Bombina bombina]|uniref:protein mono-ADP-ribosyltransferase PARP12 n=1 Tax=Bombina bombina TaxID=8345 RepID=UPI00235B09FB|nr:protein mono-ADP-ribosyltransferase PARP12 [Bombina bombina]